MFQLHSLKRGIHLSSSTSILKAVRSNDPLNSYQKYLKSQLHYQLSYSTSSHYISQIKKYSTKPSPEIKDEGENQPEKLTQPKNIKGHKKEAVSVISWRSLGVAATIGGLFVAFLWKIKNEKDLAIEKERKRILGKASLGGRFDLIDQDGKTVKSEDFLGKWLLIYFGFTHCPDVCPDELEKLATVTDLVDKENDPELQVQPLFITVDPARDTVAAVKKYIREFSPRFIGLTGSVEEIAKACKAYRVYFSAGPRDYEDDYIVDHTIIIYLVNPDGEFVDYFGQTKSANEIYGALQISMQKYKAMKSKWF